MLEHHHCLFTRANRCHLRQLLDRLVYPHRWQGQVDRGQLVQKKVNRRVRGGDADVSAVEFAGRRHHLHRFLPFLLHG
jgi:hypothetical protein